MTFSLCIMTFKDIWILQSKTSQKMCFGLFRKITFLLLFLNQLFDHLFFYCAIHKPTKSMRFLLYRQDRFHTKARRGRRTVINFNLFYCVCLWFVKQQNLWQTVQGMAIYIHVYVYTFIGRRRKVCLLLDQEHFNAINLSIVSPNLD